jgi:uncharacterized protein
MVSKPLPQLPQTEPQPFDCQAALPAEAIKGLEYFNEGKFFEAHEELETAWRREKGPIRELYRGILQVGVAYLHIQRGNYEGARKMLLRCRQWLDPFPDECCGVNLARLRQDFERVENQLKSLESGAPVHFNFQPIFYRTPSHGNQPPISE